MSPKPFLPLLVTSLILSATVSAYAVEPYTQTYLILIKGSVAGNEKVTETTEKGEITSISEHEIIITDGLEAKRMAFSTRMVLSKASSRPVSYSYKYSGPSGDSYDVAIKDNQIKRILKRGDRTSEITAALQPDTVVVDFNVYYQYDYLVRKYDSKKGGRQLFSNFLPVIGSDIPVALTFVGNGDLDLGKGVVAVNNFKVEFVGIWTGNLSVDKDGRLVRLFIPAQDLEVLRQDLVGSR